MNICAFCGFYGETVLMDLDGEGPAWACADGCQGMPPRREYPTIAPV